MRIFCSICKEIFIPYSEIHATNCGHLYHANCISRWLKQHKTCPQCRTNLLSQLTRIYFDVDKDTEEDASTLEHKLETVTSELHQSEVSNKILREKNDTCQKLMSELEENMAVIKRKNHLLKSSVQALKDQINKLSKQNEQVTQIKNDLEASKNKLRCYESLELVLNSTSDEVDKLLKGTPLTEFGVKQLSIYTSALKDKTERDKKKLTTLTNEKKELQKALMAEQAKNSNVTESEYKKLKAAYDTLKIEFNTIKDLLKQNSDKLTTADAKDSLTQTKSEASLKTPLFHINFDFVDNKAEKLKKRPSASDVSESLKHWEDLVCAGPSRHAGVFSGKSKTLNKSSNNISEDLKKAEMNYAFDGMGGRKKICLAHPTPKDEFNRIKTENKFCKKVLKMNRKKLI